MAKTRETCLLSPGTILKERWQLIERIGGGGFGEIYSTKDLLTGQVSSSLHTVRSNYM